MSISRAYKPLMSLENWGICFILFLLGIAIYAAIYCTPEYTKEIVSGLFIFGAALTTASFSFKQYREKQLTLQFQKFYFEDTLYSLAKSIDDLLKCNENNMLNTEYLINTAVNILDLEGIEPALKKEKLIELFINTRIKMDPLDNIRTFQLYTTQLLVIKSQPNMLSNWLDDIEKDSKRFLNHLTGQISKIEPLLTKLDESNITTAIETLSVSINEDVRLAYILIERHQILFKWLSFITFKFVSADYTSNKKIFEFFESKVIKEIIINVNNAYNELIKSYEKTYFTTINKDIGKQLEASIKLQNEIYAKFAVEKIS